MLRRRCSPRRERCESRADEATMHRIYDALSILCLESIVRVLMMRFATICKGASYRCAMTILSRPDSRGDKPRKGLCIKEMKIKKLSRGSRISGPPPYDTLAVFLRCSLLADDSGLAHWIGEDGGYVPRGCPIPCHGLEFDVEFRLEDKSQLS